MELISALSSLTQNCTPLFSLRRMAALPMATPLQVLHLVILDYLSLIKRIPQVSMASVGDT